jgi:hypothetical protein
MTKLFVVFNFELIDNNKDNENCQAFTAVQLVYPFVCDTGDVSE